MKKLTFFAILLFMATAGTVNAQMRRYPPPRRYPPARTTYRRPVDDFYRVKFGIVAGANISNIVNINNANFNTNTIVGWNVGASLDIPIVRPLSFEGEVLFSQKGYKAYTADGDFTQRTNWIDVPLLAKFQLAPAFNLVVGPQISFLTSTKNTYRSGFNSVSEEVYTRDADGFNKSLVGGVIGVGIDLSPNVELRGRYTLDLQDNSSDGVTYPDYRNQVFQVGLGFKF